MSAAAPPASAPLAVGSGETRVDERDWDALAAELELRSHAKLLTPDECTEIAALYPHEGYYRSHIHMARHGFGRGEYRHFKYPLPDLLGGLRTALYPRLAQVAIDWNERMGLAQHYPAQHAEFLKLCHDADQHGLDSKSPWALVRAGRPASPIAATTRCRAPRFAWC